MKNVKYIILIILLVLETNIVAQVVINEVFYDETGGDLGNEWIELKNIGGSAATITGYDLTAVSGDYYTFPSLTVPTGDFVVVHWRKVGTDDTDFGDNVAHLYTGTTGYDNNMGDTAGYVAFFNSTTHSSLTIIDYMEYGAGDQNWENDAVTAGIWSEDNFAPDVIASHSLEYDGSGNLGSDWVDRGIPTQGGENSLPVELSSFTAEFSLTGTLLKWITESEIENLGFILERKTSGSDWQEIVSYKQDESLWGQGSVSFATDYEYLDKLVQHGNTYEYRLADVDYYGVVTYHATREVFVESAPLATIADNFTVMTYPNPFNPSTTIRYSVTSCAITHIAIYDITGKIITTLINKEQPTGWYEIQWSGTNKAGKDVPGGVYLSRVTVGNDVKTSKLILLR